MDHEFIGQHNRLVGRIGGVRFEHDHVAFAVKMFDCCLVVDERHHLLIFFGGRLLPHKQEVSVFDPRLVHGGPSGAKHEIGMPGSGNFRGNFNNRLRILFGERRQSAGYGTHKRHVDGLFSHREVLTRTKLDDALGITNKASFLEAFEHKLHGSRGVIANRFSYLPQRWRYARMDDAVSNEGVALEILLVCFGHDDHYTPLSTSVNLCYIGQMEQQLAHRTVEHYLPILQAIVASLEVSCATDDKLESRTSLHFLYLEKEFGFSKLLHATHLLEVWLKGSNFEMQPLRILKKDKSVKWADLFTLLNEKMTDYHNGNPVIEISIARNGHTVRQVGTQQLVHDFGSDGNKKEILTRLAKVGDFIKTEDIQKMIGSKSVESVAKTIRAINAVLRMKLQLPQKQKLIDAKRGSGYRINPIYNVICLD